MKKEFIQKIAAVALNFVDVYTFYDALGYFPSNNEIYFQLVKNPVYIYDLFEELEESDIEKYYDMFYDFEIELLKCIINNY